jgi:hypothetical protein
MHSSAGQARHLGKRALNELADTDGSAIHKLREYRFVHAFALVLSTISTKSTVLLGSSVGVLRLALQLTHTSRMDLDQGNVL